MPGVGPALRPAWWTRYLSAIIAAAQNGGKGPSVEERRDALIEDELIGLVGPIVDVYSPEESNQVSADAE